MNEERLLGENAVTFLKNLSVRGRPLRMRLWPNFGARNGARMTRKKIWGSHTSLRQPKEGDNGGGVGKYIPSQIIQIMVIFFASNEAQKSLASSRTRQACLPFSQYWLCLHGSLSFPDALRSAPSRGSLKDSSEGGCPAGQPEKNS